MDVPELPRIGNHSDALELLEEVVAIVEGLDEPFLKSAIAALKDALERDII